MLELAGRRECQLQIIFHQAQWLQRPGGGMGRAGLWSPLSAGLQVGAGALPQWVRCRRELIAVGGIVELCASSEA